MVVVDDDDALTACAELLVVQPDAMLRALACSSLLVVAACGGDDACPVTVDAAPSPDSAPVDPACAGAACGGDLTGTWTITASCAAGTGDASFFGCSDGTMAFRDLVTGTWSFGADGTVIASFAEHARASAELPLSCYEGFDCATLESLAEAQGLVASCQDRGATDPATCEVVADACACNLTVDEPDVTLVASIVTQADGTYVLTADHPRRLLRRRRHAVAPRGPVRRGPLLVRVHARQLRDQKQETGDRRPGTGNGQSSMR